MRLFNLISVLLSESVFLTEVGALIIQIDKYIINNYRSSNFSSNYQFTKMNDSSITNRQNRILNGSIIIDLGKNHRGIAFIDLNY